VLKVLVVDDSLFMRKHLEIMLVELKYEVVGLAKDGHQALAAYDILKPDIVLMDVDIPDMNGIEVLSILKEKDQSVKIVILTAQHDSDIIKFALKAGAENYLFKPPTFTKLNDAIRKILPKENISKTKVILESEPLNENFYKLEDL